MRLPLNFIISFRQYFFPTILVPTKINQKTNTIIDNISTNQYSPGIICGNQYNPGIICRNFIVSIYDHPSFAIFPNHKIGHKPKKHNIFKRELSKLKENDLKLRTIFIKLTGTLSYSSTERVEIYLLIRFSVDRILQKYCPLKKIKNNEFKCMDKPMITEGIIPSMRKRDNFFQNMSNQKVIQMNYPGTMNIKICEIKSMNLYVQANSNTFKTTF